MFCKQLELQLFVATSDTNANFSSLHKSEHMNTQAEFVWSENYLMHVDGMETHLCRGKLRVQRIALDVRVTGRNRDLTLDLSINLSVTIKDEVALLNVPSQIPVKNCAIAVIHGGLRVAGGRQETM